MIESLPAGCCAGCEVSITNDGDFTVATVKFYPNVMHVKVDRKNATYRELFDKIREAFLQCHAWKDVQF